MSFKRKLCLFAVATLVVVFVFWSSRMGITVFMGLPTMCPGQPSEETITRLHGTKHLLVSAYADRRVSGKDIRIIGIFNRYSAQELHCVFCCQGSMSGQSPATVLLHSDNFGYPYVTTDVLCQTPAGCKGSHVALVPSQLRATTENLAWLPVRNLKEAEQEEARLPFNLTVCISVLFENFNNVLQAADLYILEMYRLLGVNKVVIYNISSGPELDRLLHSYSQEGFLETVPWPINWHLTLSHGWLFSESGGDLHYFRQLTTLNECIYRSMHQSRYVLLNDLDEIIMPYQHDDLPSLISDLQQQHPDVHEFRIENHIFPKTHVEPSGKFQLPQWEGVPGLNILQHIYREEPDYSIYHPYKMIVRPRLVEQTSVHEVLKKSGKSYKVPREVCRIIHVRTPLRASLKLEQLHMDMRLWDFHQKLIPSVNQALRRAGE
uniref:Glycosyltransferase family 92 protein n=1 Tax=Hippocampus comes TaxID=109280 RepID=A0A3Q2YHQ5_HIPCM